MEDFDSVVNAQYGSRNPFIAGGSYLLVVKNLFYKKGHKGLSFRGEFVVEESVKSDPECDPSAVGSTVAYIQNLSKDSAPSNIKTFLIELLGLSPKISTEDFKKEFNAVFGDEAQEKQLLRGFAIKCTTRRGGTKANPGANFVFPNFENYKLNTPESVKARREKIEA